MHSMQARNADTARIMAQQPTGPGDDMLPLFFGWPREELFACYHPAAGEARDHAVVLCQPVGQEYIRAHRSFVLLARRLARHGFTVLRFDYHATGDSAGDTEQGRLPRWIADARAAVAEVRRRSRPSRISLVGLRLGATIAATAAAAEDDIAGVVLWDPVIDGRAHLDELTALQADVLRYEYVNVADAGAAATGEVLGFPLPAELRAQIGAVDLTTLPRAPAPHVLLIESGEPAGLQRLGRSLAANVNFEHCHIVGPRIWLTETFHGIVPQQVLETMIGWLERI
jgi:uncharacterized protein